MISDVVAICAATVLCVAFVSLTLLCVLTLLRTGSTSGFRDLAEVVWAVRGQPRRRLKVKGRKPAPPAEE